MLVVADTSPIHVLVRIEQIQILPALFGNIWIPTVVADELRSAKHHVVRQFIAVPPDWIMVVEPVAIEQIPRLHSGEEAAIALAIEFTADAILMDDHDARIEAAKRGLRIVGTLGLLERAFLAGLVDLRSAIDRIRATDFRVTDQLLQSVLDRHYPSVPE